MNKRYASSGLKRAVDAIVRDVPGKQYLSSKPVSQMSLVEVNHELSYGSDNPRYDELVARKKKYEDQRKLDYEKWQSYQK